MKYSGFENEKHFDRFSFYNGDCMDLLKQTPDKYYELAIERINGIYWHFN